MPSTPRIADAPGLDIEQRAAGYTLRWRAPRKAARDGYEPASVKIDDLDPADPEHHDLIRAECRRHQAAYEAWLTGKAAPTKYDGTLRSLCRMYQEHEASPFLRVKSNTRRGYLHEVKVIERAFGKRTLAGITAVDFLRWYEETKKRTQGSADGVRKAHGVINRLRAMTTFGKLVEDQRCVSACRRLREILEEMEFAKPAKRREHVAYEHAVAIIAKAHELGRPSIALAQALQFEAALRQVDVIGQWLALGDEHASPYRLGRRVWTGGLVWQDISDDLVLSKDTTKNGARASHDLKRMPLVMAELMRIPKAQRLGPMIMDETAGRPYAEFAFGREWRAIADAAGVPKAIWNRDSRAGAISEGDEAGATIGDLQRVATHSSAKMTGRYIRGEGLKASRTVASLRTKHRNRPETSGK
ncbi:integrase [Labrys wisconsinensis]|uniref:Integrase n=1 Tax=Labrys wisconsinensis TaxID=425677 RepID=A0ABU0JGQ7_9HYPH|nr:integrase [Labrys wisconsinensis]MDQ0472770.1 hypothetical protein [Labrys wisconsinensis]